MRSFSMGQYPLVDTLDIAVLLILPFLLGALAQLLDDSAPNAWLLPFGFFPQGYQDGQAHLVRELHQGYTVD